MFIVSKSSRLYAIEDNTFGVGVSAWPMFGQDAKHSRTLKDADQDGIADVDESLYGTDMANPDTDNDGMNDGEEASIGRNPTVNEPAVMSIIQNLLLD